MLQTTMCSEGLIKVRLAAWRLNSCYMHRSSTVRQVPVRDVWQARTARAAPGTGSEAP